MDRDSVERYVAEYGKSLTRLCLKLCRNRAEAEDLYQETWCRVLAKLKLYHESQPFEPWLFTLCLNLYRNRYTSKKRQPLAEFGTQEEQDRAMDSASVDAPVFNAEHDHIRQIIDRMDDKHRMVIVLYYFREYSVAEMAAMLRVPQGTVKSRLSKARGIIKRRLEEDEASNVGA